MSCWKEGDPGSDVLVLGMAPGREELVADSPFVGPSGRLLWSLLKRAGVDRADCYILNCIPEWPAAKTGGPTAQQLEAHWDAFDSAVADFRGRVALLLGGDALQRFTGLIGGVKAWGGYLVRPDECKLLSRSRNTLVPYKANGKGHKKGDLRTVRVKELVRAPQAANLQLILPALHPAAVLRTGLAEAPILASQCKRLGRFLRNELLPSRNTYVEYPVQWPSNTPEVAVDIETGGIDNGITRIGLASDTDCWTAPWGGTARNVAAAVLARGDTEYIIHNAGFDVPRLAAAGAPVSGRIRDTMLGAALLQPDLPKGLNAAASLYLDCARWKHEADDAPARYNALDAIRELELWHQEKALLQNSGQLGLFCDTIMGALPTLIRMTTTGIAISTERRDAWLAELSARGGELTQEWSAKTNGCSFRSPFQLKDLFKRLGMELPYNKHGGETTDKMGLAKLKGDYPEHAELLDLLLDARGVYKDIETYAKVSVGGDGRVHPSFVPAYKDQDELGKGIAGTWRITAKEPNMQNQPERARRMFVPSAEMVFVGADYGQLEARILAWLAGDDVLLAACDGDIHARNMAALGVDRTRAKNAFFGWSYLAGPKVLQNTFAGRGFKVTQAECQTLLDGFNKTYHRAAGFRQEALARFQAQRYVQNPFNLRRYFPHSTFPAPAAMSTLIQSTGAIMMWRILPQLEAALTGLGGQLLLTVHDDILGEVPAENRDKALTAITEIMGQTFPEVANGFRVPCAPKWSADSWGEMHPAPEGAAR